MPMRSGDSVSDARVIYLDLEDLVRICSRLIGDPPPIRDLGLLGAAADRPQTSLFGEDAYPDLVTKAAALLQSVVNNHPLIDGNKRLGWVATATFLEINGRSAALIDNDAVYDLVMWVASSNPDLAQITMRLGGLLDSV